MFGSFAATKKPRQGSVSSSPSSSHDDFLGDFYSTESPELSSPDSDIDLMNSDEGVEEWENDSVSNDISDDSEPEDGEISFVNISHSDSIGAMVDSLLTLQGAFHLSNTAFCFLDFCQLS